MKTEAVSKSEKTPHTDPMTAAEAHTRRFVLWDHLPLSVSPKKAESMDAINSGVKSNMQLKAHPADNSSTQKIWGQNFRLLKTLP